MVSRLFKGLATVALLAFIVADFIFPYLAVFAFLLLTAWIDDCGGVGP